MLKKAFTVAIRGGVCRRWRAEVQARLMSLPVATRAEAAPQFSPQVRANGEQFDVPVNSQFFESHKATSRVDEFRMLVAGSWQGVGRARRSQSSVSVQVRGGHTARAGVVVLLAAAGWSFSRGPAARSRRTPLALPCTLFRLRFAPRVAAIGTLRSESASVACHRCISTVESFARGELLRGRRAVRAARS